MPWVKFSEDLGNRTQAVQLNNEGLWQLCRQYAAAELLLKHSKTVTHSRAFGPTLKSVETDFDAVSKSVVAHTAAKHMELLPQVIAKPSRGFEMLVETRKKQEKMNDERRVLVQDASKFSMASINSSVSTCETAVKVLKFTRDASKGVLVVGAGFVTGGAAIAALATGAGLAGTSKYLDGVFIEGKSATDGRLISGAILETTSEFVMGALGTGAFKSAMAASSRAEKFVATIVIAKVDFGLEVAKGLIDGKSALEAAGLAGTKMIAGKLIEPIFGKMLGKLPMPVLSRLKQAAPEMTVDFVAEAGAEVVSSAVQDRMSQRIDARPSKPVDYKKMQCFAEPKMDASIFHSLSTYSDPAKDYIEKNVMRFAV